MSFPLKTIETGHGGTASWLPDNRLHLQQGPINLVIKAYGPDIAVYKSYKKAIAGFEDILPGLVQNLPLLRQPVNHRDHRAHRTHRTQIEDCPTAQRMLKAVSCYDHIFVTPMASVAGAVADEILSIMYDVLGIEKILVNNGGDIAIYLAQNQTINIGVVPCLAEAIAEAKITVTAQDQIGGIATSGWNGNSYSLGIADAVTVLAPNAANADVAATLIANKVNVDDKAIRRKPAYELDDHSDLSHRLVTVRVDPLPEIKIKTALNKGLDFAYELVRKRHISSVLLSLQGQWASTDETLMQKNNRKIINV